MQSSGTFRGMLVLNRQPQETVHIGDEVTVTVLSVDGNQVRLGIRAPLHIAVHREEIYRRIQDNKCAAAKVSSASPQVVVRRSRSRPAD
jgi:carbon storage regulator